MERKRKKKNKFSEEPLTKMGPRMADVFLSDSQGLIPSIIHLPRIIHLRVEKEKSGHNSFVLESKREIEKETIENEKKNALPVSNRIIQNPGENHEPLSESRYGAGEDAIIFHFPAVAEIPEPLQAEEIQNELNSLLSDEEQREAKFIERVEAEKKCKRAEIAQKIRLVPSRGSEVLHLKQEIAPLRKFVLKKEVPRQEVISRDEKILRDLILRDSADGSIPWVAPPVSWRNFRQKAVSRSDRAERGKKEISGVIEIIPKKQNILRNKTGTDKTKTKKEERIFFHGSALKEAGIVIASVVLFGTLTGFVSSFSALPRLKETLETKARDGATYLLSGLKSMTVADVSAGQRDLLEASRFFSEAEEQLKESTNVAQRILARLDPKERFETGSILLATGKKLADLGGETEELARLFSSNFSGQFSLTETLEKSAPALNMLATEIGKINKDMARINPDSLKNDMRAEFIKLQDGVAALSGVLTGYLDSQEVLLRLLGAKQDSQYLFIFENNREIRPGGGFIGSFALTDFSRGLVKKVKVDTIYNPDGQLKEFIVPPAPLKKLTDRWYTRDANWFADFRTNAQKISELFEKSGGPTVDGVIAITPTVLENLLRVTGPISMPEYGVTVTDENVIDETQRLVTFEYDKESGNPKQFLSDLLPEVLKRVAEMPREKWGTALGLLTDSLKQKQILLWFRNEEAQKKSENLNWSGAVRDATMDYLMRVEANVGGHKTDELIEQDVRYDVTVEDDGKATATLVVTRHHRGSKQGRADWNPDEDWYRKANVIYERTLVPRGSELLEARGFKKTEEVPSPYKNQTDYSMYLRDRNLEDLEKGEFRHENGTVISEESGKTSFGNWIITEPGETTVTVYRYRLPFSFNLTALIVSPFSYHLLTQKQPGHQPVQMSADFHLPEGFKILWAGPEAGVAYEGKRKASFTAILASDSVWGIVAERL